MSELIGLNPQRLVDDFSNALVTVDHTRPVAVNQRNGSPYQPGIGPHTENKTLSLIADQLRHDYPDRYPDIASDIPYPSAKRQKCDWLLGPIEGGWFIEAKMMRLMGDNGKPNDNILTHILSPYPQHRSALTDCDKLASSGFSGRLFILIYGYAYEDYPLEPTIEAFELLARSRRSIGDCFSTYFDGLVHHVHTHGAVYLWELLD